MTAVAVRDMRPPRRLGMKILAAGLTLVCTIQLLLAFEEARTVAALRATQAGVPAGRAGDWLGQAWTAMTRAVNPSPPIEADPEDRMLAGQFSAADEETRTRVSTVAFEGAAVVLDGGAKVQTSPLRIAAGSDALDRAETFARTLKAAPDAQIELRAVVASETDPELCGAAAPVALALLYRGQTVDLMWLRAAPGPETDPGIVCARWALKAG